MSFSSPPEALGVMPDLQPTGRRPGAMCRVREMGVSREMLGWCRRTLLVMHPTPFEEDVGPARRVKADCGTADCDEEGDRPTRVGGLSPPRRAAGPCKEKTHKLQ